MKKSFILFIILIISSSSSIYGQKRDTLFINYNDNLLLKKWQDPNNNEFSYRIKGTGNNGLVYLLEQKKYNNLKHKKIKCLKKFLKKKDIYNKKGKKDDWKLNQFLDKYIIFLVKGKEFTKLEPRYEID
ncbi:hypothetical protein [Polaribacter gangjinensis]|uniref:Uncharacterized protein n=1 Tax=Polaribacter gangjinensis TaxID=574710 RepID=A0A2S7W9R0_9FLAO|nr:hypothetical protein [Polaribacter gangjinensis]PQJ74146.1 hypothetical protein BTO13_02150 [Polaribacter gangjinensis]